MKKLIGVSDGFANGYSSALRALTMETRLTYRSESAHPRLTQGRKAGSNELAPNKQRQGEIKPEDGEAETEVCLTARR